MIFVLDNFKRKEEDAHIEKSAVLDSQPHSGHRIGLPELVEVDSPENGIFLI